MSSSLAVKLREGAKKNRKTGLEQDLYYYYGGVSMTMFNELEGNLIKAIETILFNTLTQQRAQSSTELATAE